MARRFATAIDLQQNELQRARLHNVVADPAGVEGQILWRSDTNELKIYDGSAWVTLPIGAITSAMIADGAIANIDVAAGAAIARSKLDFGAGLLNADIAAAAAIAYTKLSLGASIVNTDINAAAAIARTKLDFGAGLTNTDIAAAAAIALSKLATDPLARANHTGSQLAATISDFNTAVRLNRLDQLAVPTAAVPHGGQLITGLADPVSAQDAATKAYVDAIAQGLDVKASVRAASTATVTVASPGANIDGVALSAGDRVLLKDQSTASQNGLYVWNGAATPMTRAADADASADVTSGMFTFVEEGTVNADSGWILTTNNPIVLATTSLAFAQFSGAGQITAGAGLTKTGNTLDVVGGAGITVAADLISIAAGAIVDSMITAMAASKLTGAVAIANGGTAGTTAATARTGLLTPGRYDNAATHAAGASITITAATHGLGAGRNKMVQVIEEASGDVVETDINVAANGDVVVTFASAQLLNTHRVLIAGW